MICTTAADHLELQARIAREHAAALSQTQLGILGRIASGANFTSYSEASLGQWSGADRRALAEAGLIEPNYRWPVTNWSLVRRTPLGDAVAQHAVSVPLAV